MKVVNQRRGKGLCKHGLLHNLLAAHYNVSIVCRKNSITKTIGTLMQQHMYLGSGDV